MKKIVGTLLVTAAALTTALPAHAMNWSLGANLGMAIFMPDDKYVGADNITQFSWPSNAVPGIRVGFTGANPAHEFFLDTALELTSTEGLNTREFAATANYQYNFGTGSVAPYVTAGGGFQVLGFKEDVDFGPPIGVQEVEGSATSAVFGGGAGLRHKMGNGHGVLRGEVRYDLQTEGEDSDVGVLIPKGGAFQVKLGFDFWDQ